MDFAQSKVEILKPNLEPHDNWLLIDADSIAYASAYNAEGADVTLAESMFYNSIKFIMQRTGSSKAKLYYTKGRNSFRYKLYEEYKKPRLNHSYPELLAELKSRLSQQKFANIEVIWSEAYEADDAVVRDAKLYEGCVAAALDKDVLNSIEGKHYNVQKDEFVVTEQSMVKFWPYYQTIVGDNSDNIPGAYRIGPKKATQFINESMSELQLWQGVLEAYRIAGNSEREALRNMRLVNMHQLLGESIVLWDPDYLLLKDDSGTFK